MMMKKQTAKKMRNLSREYLVRATYRYLERFSTTKGNLIQVLLRKADKILQENETYEGEEKTNLRLQAEDWIEDIAEKSVKQGLVNDHNYALSKVRSLYRSGNSTSQITGKLYGKLVPQDIIDQVLEEVREEMPNATYFAAAKYVRKRRFGAFRLKEKDLSAIEKEKASMARAGFSFDIVTKILDMEHDELENIIYAQGRFK